MTPTCFSNMVKKTKEYNLSMKHGKSSLRQRIENAERYTADRHTAGAGSDREMEELQYNWNEY